MNDARRRLGRDALWSTAGVLLSSGAQFLLSVLVGRIGGPGLLGMVRGALSLANTASLAWSSSAGQSASMFLAREQSAHAASRAAFAERHLVTRAIQSALALAPIAAAGSVVLFGFRVADAVWVAALVLALAAYQVARGVRFGKGRVRQATGWELVNAVATLTLLAVVLETRMPGWILAPLVVGNLLYAAGVLARRPRDTVNDDALAREMDVFVAWGVAGSIASSGMIQLSMVMSATALGKEPAGWYAAAVSLATPLSMAARALSMALFPQMARHRGRGDDDATREMTDLTTRGLLMVMTPVFASLALVAEPLMRLVYRDDFAPAVTPLRILLSAVWLSTVASAAVNSINVLGRAGVRFSALLSWAGFVVGIASMALLLPHWGVVGVAVGYLAGVVTTAVAALVHVWRRDAHRWTPPVLASVAVLVLVGGAVTGPSVLASWRWAIPVAVGLDVLWAAGCWRAWHRTERR